jgi:hypothetical protein
MTEIGLTGLLECLVTLKWDPQRENYLKSNKGNVIGVHYTSPVRISWKETISNQVQKEERMG